MGIIDKISDALPIKPAAKGHSSASVVQKPSGEMHDWQRRHIEALVRFEKASAAAPNPGALEEQVRLEERHLRKLNPGTHRSDHEIEAMNKVSQRAEKAAAYAALEKNLQQRDKAAGKNQDRGQDMGR